MSSNILVVAPHPDDEVLGCGGTLLRRRSEGCRIGWLIVTAIREEEGWHSSNIDIRQQEINKVSHAFGFDEVFELGFPAAYLDGLPMKSLVSEFARVFNAFKPSEIFIPHFGDVHSDHRVVAEIVASCTKWFRYPFINRILSYEVPSETEFGLDPADIFRPNIYIDIGNYLEKKLEIMQLYKSEVADFPFPRSIEAMRSLAKWRGANSGYHAAEAFQLLRSRE